MSGFVIKYIDIYNLLWEYKSKLERLIEGIETCETNINNFIQYADFEGETADAIKSYMNDVHITMLSSFKVTARNILDNMALYKAGYYEIDSATNFVLPEEVIKEFQEKINANLVDTEAYAETIRQAVSDISDISAVSNPDMNGIVEIHEQLDEELIQLVADIEEQESSTVTALKNSTDLLISSLETCTGKIGMNCPDISKYESYSFYTDADVYALAGMSQIFYDQQQNNRDFYEEVWQIEQNLKEMAEERQTQGIWKTVGGIALIVVGVICIVATAGAATPVVVAGGVAGSGTILFGVADSTEGAQDIYYGSIGDIDSTVVNELKDDIFQGNEEAYYFTENVFAFAASSMIPIGKAADAGKLTFRSGAAIVAKEGISTAAGEGTAKITMNVTGNQTASMLAGMMASGLTASGLNKIDGKFKISGFAEGSKSGLDAKKIKYYLSKSKNNIDSDTVILGSTGKYDIIAETEGYTYFKMSDDVWALLEKEAGGNYDEIWKVNQQFIDEQIAANKNILLSNDPYKGYYFDDGTKRFYQREIDYMISIGYTFESAGDGLWKAVRK